MNARAQVQAHNSLADLKAIMDNYESKISEQYPSAIWLAHALQKDGIQNCLGALAKGRLNDWSCDIAVEHMAGKDYLTIVDKGTTGLKGRTPGGSNPEAAKIIAQVEGTRSQDDENLSYFLSSNYTNKTEKNTGGSRGRGKSVFIAASKSKTFHFDSIRPDGSYIFGTYFIDHVSKETKVMCSEGLSADEDRNEVFSRSLRRLSDQGTRILISEPDETIVDAIESGAMARYIQETWWEIIEKGYHITVSSPTQGRHAVKASDWLGISKQETEIKRIYESNLNLQKHKDLRVKRIAFCFMTDPVLPENYRGIAIQRDGMTIERVSVHKFIDVDGASSIYGTVEISDQLANEIKNYYEDPEHYKVGLSKGLGLELKNLIKLKLTEFSKEIGLNKAEDERKLKRESEMEVQKQLNQLAKKLGFTMEGRGLVKKARESSRIADPYPLRLVFKGLKTPQENNRVDYGEQVQGAYVVAVNEDRSHSHKVKLTTWIVYKGEDGKSKVSYDLAEKLEHQVEIVDLGPGDTTGQVGWDVLNIDKTIFEARGVYVFKARLNALETIELKVQNEDGTYRQEVIAKGDPVGSPIQVPFYVDVDKPSEGLFSIDPSPSQDKKKYYWWTSHDGIEIRYNDEHPVFKMIQKVKYLDDRKKGEFTELYKIGLMVLATETFEQDCELVDLGEKPKLYTRDEILGSKDSVHDTYNTILNKTSEWLWEVVG